MKRSLTKKSRRGFTLLIVLFIVAVGMAMASAMLSSTPSKVLAAAAKNSEVIARSISEACLERATNVARYTINRTAAEDFDALLDPGNNALGSFDNNMFVPGPVGDPVVYVPPGATGNDEMMARHRYRYAYDAAREGACLTRYDDNHDDFFDNNGLSPDSAAENANVGDDVQRRDRDRSIIITTIGIYPVRAGTVAADAYAAAKSRVTSRGVLQTAVTSTAASGAAVHTTGVIDADGIGGGGSVLTICGDSASAMYSGGTGGDTDRVCTCGNNQTPGTHIEGCTGVCSSIEGCATPVDNGGAPPALPPAPLTVPTTEFNVQQGHLNNPGGFSKASVYGASGPQANTCSFFFQRAFAFGGSYGAAPAGADPVQPAYATDAVVYIWDHDAGDPWAAGANPANLPTTTFVAGVNNANVALPAPGTAGVFDRCDADPGATVPAPCDWYFEFGGGNGTFTQCSEGQSPCWVPVAILDSTLNVPGEFFATNEMSHKTGTSSPHDEAFHPRNNDVLALYSGVTNMQNFCGPRAENTVRAGFAWDHQNATPADNDWIIVDDMDGRHWPDRGVFLIFDDDWVPGTNTTSNYSLLADNKEFGTQNNPLRMTIASTGRLWFDDEVNVCCPGCNCAGFSSLDNGNNCEAADPVVLNPSAQPAIIAGGICAFDDNKDKMAIGNLQCRAIQIEEDVDCWAGDLVATDLCDDGNCTPDTYCFDTTGGNAQDPGICLGEKIHINGNLLSAGDVVLDEKVEIYANVAGSRYVIANDDVIVRKKNKIHAELFMVVGSGHFAFRDEKNTIYGRIVAGTGGVWVEDKKNKIVWNGDNGVASFTVTANAMWYESTW